MVELYRQGKSIAAIARELHMSPITVRKFAYAGAFPERSAHKRRQSYLLTPYLPSLHQRVAEGCENASLLWKEICQLGFAQGYKVVNSWLREYLGKPGRSSTDEEKAKHQYAHGESRSRTRSCFRFPADDAGGKRTCIWRGGD